MENLVKELHSEIAVTGNGRCLLWVDPAQHDVYAGHDMVAQRRVRVSINHQRFAPQRAPYLVPLDLSEPGDADLFNDSVERAWQAWTLDSLRALEGQPICGWVITQSPAETLANHWGRRCHIHGHQYKSKLLRFHDPGVREWLWPTLSATQQLSLLGPAACVFSIGRDHNLLRHAGEAGDFAAVPFKLTDQQWRQLGDYATVHAAWVACAATADSTELTRPFSEALLVAVLAALDQATRHGVTQRSERTLYARHALLLGPRFHADPRMQPVWEQTRAGHYYGSAMEAVFDGAADELHLQWTSTEEKTAWPT